MTSKTQNFRHFMQLIFNAMTIFSFSTAIFRSGVYIPYSYEANVIGLKTDNHEITGYIEGFLDGDQSYFWTRTNCTDSYCDLYSMLSVYLGSDRSSVIKFINADENDAQLVVHFKHPWFFYDTVNDLVSGFVQHLGAPNGFYLNTEGCVPINGNIRDFKHATKDLNCSRILLTKVPRRKNSTFFFTHQFPSRFDSMKYSFNNLDSPKIQLLLDSVGPRYRNIHNDIFFKTFEKRRSIVWYRRNVSGTDQIDILQGILREGLSTIPNQIQPTESVIQSIPKYDYLFPADEGNFTYTFIARSNLFSNSLFGFEAFVDGILIGGPNNQTSQFEIYCKGQYQNAILTELKLRWMCQLYIYLSILLYTNMIRRSVNTTHWTEKLKRTCKWFSTCDFGSLLANDVFLSFSLCYTVFYYGYSSAYRWSVQINAISPNAKYDVHVPQTFKSTMVMLSENGRGTFNNILFFQVFFLCTRQFLPERFTSKLMVKAIESQKKRNDLCQNRIHDTNTVSKIVSNRLDKEKLVLRVKYRVYGLIVAIYTFLVIMGLDGEAPRSKDVRDSDNEFLYTLDTLSGTKFQPSILTFVFMWLIILGFPATWLIYEILPSPVLCFEKYRVFSISSLIMDKEGYHIHSIPVLLEILTRTHLWDQKEYLDLLMAKKTGHVE